MTVEELDLARAKVLRAFDRGFLGTRLETEWPNISDESKSYWLSMARSIRLGDEARGLRVVPVEATKEMILAGEIELDDCRDSGWDSGSDGESHNTYEYIIPGAETKIYAAMLAASPFAPGEGDD